ncbi:MAG: phosphoribosyltransferase [Planctomycetaceae bacterium]|nr:phosphoribosyltransferase [Planctomycetaceae bacterium]
MSDLDSKSELPSAVQFPECEQFTGRQREICRGEVLTPEKCRQYRVLWGLEPDDNVGRRLRQESRRMTVAERVQTASQVLANTAIRGVTTGKVYVDADVRDQRLAICQACEHFDRGRCKLCGCACNKSNSLANKLSHASSQCPLNPPKWGPVGVDSRAKPPVRPQAAKVKHPFAVVSTATPMFITTARLMDDTKILASRLPADTSMIIGIARSGLCVATMVSMLLHRPLTIFRQSSYDLVPAGNGWRLTGNIAGLGRAVVIDDTVMSGNSFKYVMPVVRQTYPEAIGAAVYVNPAAHHKPDLWVHDLPHPHLLEWNLSNSIFSPHSAVDFDGVLCHDCPAGSDDDGERYAEFLRNAPPLYLNRKTPVPLIVTARLEKYRTQTMDWLSRHGVSVKQLVMGPWQNNVERSHSDVARFKAEHYKRFLLQRHAIQPPLFIESEPRQAERIAQLAGGIVVCPAAGRCYP